MNLIDDWEKKFDAILLGAQGIKDTCLNRNDPKFAPWHKTARELVTLYAPQKLPTFDEIRFASDYFLAKTRAEQQDIDDRIALVSDIDLFHKIVSTLVANLRKKSRKFVKLEEIIQAEEKPPPPAGLEPAPVQWEQSGHSLQASRAIVLSLSLSRHDEEEALREIDRVEHELGKSHPNWDLLKRTIKYFLDFDQKLAREIIPLILSRIPSR